MFLSAEEAVASRRAAPHEEDWDVTVRSIIVVWCDVVWKWLAVRADPAVDCSASFRGRVGWGLEYCRI